MKVIGKREIIIDTSVEQLVNIVLLEHGTNRQVDSLIIHIRQRIDPLSYVEMNGQKYNFSCVPEMNAIVDKLLFEKDYEAVSSVL